MKLISLKSQQRIPIFILFILAVNEQRKGYSQTLYVYIYKEVAQPAYTFENFHSYIIPPFYTFVGPYSMVP